MIKREIVLDSFPFSNLLRNIRAIKIDNKKYYVARDLADALGYGDTSNRHYMYRSIPTEDKRLLKYDDVRKVFKSFNDTELKPYRKGMWLITEDGMYNAIFNSETKVAMDLKAMVFKDIVSQLFVTGKKESAYLDESLTMDELLTDYLNIEDGEDLYNEVREEFPDVAEDVFDYAFDASLRYIIKPNCMQYKREVINDRLNKDICRILKQYIQVRYSTQ